MIPPTLKQKVIDLVCDQAIYSRTKSYFNENMTGRFLLGQWHTSKAMCNVLVTAFSGYGIYNIAACGVLRWLIIKHMLHQYKKLFVRIFQWLNFLICYTKIY